MNIQKLTIDIDFEIPATSKNCLEWNLKSRIHALHSLTNGVHNLFSLADKVLDGNFKTSDGRIEECRDLAHTDFVARSEFDLSDEFEFGDDEVQLDRNGQL